MSNPAIPWQLLQLDPDTDAPRLMQNFEAILDWLLTEAVHRHHAQSFTFSLTTIAAGGIQDFGFTFSPSFVAIPICVLGVQSEGLPGGTARISGEVFNLTTSGGSVRWFNNSAGALAAGHVGTMIAFDSTYDVSL
jgi:hypothetical protein